MEKFYVAFYDPKTRQGWGVWIPGYDNAKYLSQIVCREKSFCTGILKPKTKANA